MVYKQLMFEELLKDAIKERDQGYAEREKSIQDRIEKLGYNDPIDQKKLDKAKAELSKLVLVSNLRQLFVETRIN